MTAQKLFAKITYVIKNDYTKRRGGSQVATQRTTYANLMALAEAQGGVGAYAYAFGFVWTFLKKEQKAEIERMAAEMLAELETQSD